MAKGDEARLTRYAAELARLTATLADIGFIWQGTIQWRRLKCGKQNCACQTNPDARHGPYAYWTTKKEQKTVSKILTAEEASLYEEWIENRRQLDKIVKQMKRLSRKAAPAALRVRARKESEQSDRA